MDDVCGAMVQMDLDGRIISWNQSAENILGFKEEEVLGINGVQNIFVNNVGDEDMLDVAKTGEVYYSFESYVRNSNGEMQPVALVTSPISDEEGTVTGVTILISNILLI
ncbi:MAG: hypothetical protein C0602_07400 [Denitrovibrio sp.]|nr:MAG: hypothetical protein C0602_07400 [Denitrovibrio sp.]